jgi:hypothetical protein
MASSRAVSGSRSFSGTPPPRSAELWECPSSRPSSPWPRSSHRTRPRRPACLRPSRKNSSRSNTCTSRRRPGSRRRLRRPPRRQSRPSRRGSPPRSCSSTSPAPPSRRCTRTPLSCSSRRCSPAIRPWRRSTRAIPASGSPADSSSRGLPRSVPCCSRIRTPQSCLGGNRGARRRRSHRLRTRRRPARLRSRGTRRRTRPGPAAPRRRRASSGLGRACAS